MPPGIKPPQHCASPEPFRLDADSTTVFLFRNLSLLHSVLRIPQNIIRLQPFAVHDFHVPALSDADVQRW
ncbi:hypothetical protein C7K59_08605 [Escherichia coli]|nr:hypothetical protein C7K59_08605 [Escherichia coli]